jgi:4-diphosphocytidyl-2-C-methyl-D-erythritol kinase
MIPRYSVVTARPEHLQALSRIELSAARLLRGHAPESVLNDTTDTATFAEAQHHGRLWVALAGDDPVGFALVVMLANDLPHLDELDVEPSHGRRGLGAILLQAVCEWACDAGYAEVTLTTFRAVPWNMPWYTRRGFVEIPPVLLRPELAEVVLEEAGRGMPSETRVVMSYRCAPPSNPGWSGPAAARLIMAESHVRPAAQPPVVRRRRGELR